jgi:hypothetical protein
MQKILMKPIANSKFLSKLIVVLTIVPLTVIADKDVVW